MSLKNLFYFIVAFLPLKGIAQHKVFSYNQIQTRNDFQEWGKIEP